MLKAELEEKVAELEAVLEQARTIIDTALGIETDDFEYGDEDGVGQEDDDE